MDLIDRYVLGKQYNSLTGNTIIPNVTKKHKEHVNFSAEIIKTSTSKENVAEVSPNFSLKNFNALDTENIESKAVKEYPKLPLIQ